MFFLVISLSFSYILYLLYSERKQNKTLLLCVVFHYLNTFSNINVAYLTSVTRVILCLKAQEKIHQPRS